MLDLLILPACVLLNRVRGGGFGAVYLPSRPLFWVAATIGLLCWLLSGSWPLGLAWAAGYVAWGLWGWANWWDTGRDPPLGRDSTSVRAIERIAALLPVPPGLHADHVALWVRHMLVLPALLAAAWAASLWWLPLLAPAWSAAVVAAYHVAWRQVRAPRTMLAELLTGALWGLLLLPTL